MSTTTGQDAKAGARAGVRNAGRLVHMVLRVMLTLAILGVVGMAALAVRLADGPMDVTWLARHAMARLVPADGSAGLGVAVVAIDGATLRWEGLHGGVQQPIDLVVTGLDARDGTGASVAAVPRAAVSVAMGPLWRGQLAFRTVDVTGLRLKLRRDAGGAIGLDTGAPTAAADPPPASRQPADPDRLAALWAQLDRIQVHDAAVAVTDDRLALAWSVPAIDIDITRRPDGDATGAASLAVSAGSETVRGTAQLALPAAGGVSATIALSSLTPARLAALAPALAPLAAMDVPLTLSGSVALDPRLGLRSATLKVLADAGTLHIGTGTMPIRGATVTADLRPAGSGQALDLKIVQLLLRARDEAPVTTVRATVSATRADGKIGAKAVVDIDQVAFADLPVLWPAGTGGPGTRPWITKNITGGIAHDGHVELTVTAPEDFSDATLTSITGGMDGSDVTGHWLRPVPPIEHGETHVVFIDPDTMDVMISAGRQAGTQLVLRPSKVRLTGLAGHDQFIAIQADIAGPFADLLTLLRNPKIKLLDRRPVTINNPAGSVTGALAVNFPLKTDLDIDNVAIHAVGKLASGHIGGIAVGRDIDHANLEYDVNNDGLKITGPGDIAGIASQLKIEMDFRNGPPSEVLERVSVTATVEPRQITALGLNVAGVLTGAIPMQLDYFDRRDTTGEVAITADLGRAGVDAARIGWHKQAGAPGSIDAKVLLKAGKLLTVEHARAEAPGLSVLVSADTASGQPNHVRIQRLVVGQTTNLTGDVRFPARDGQPYVVNLAGASIDVSAEFDRHAAARPAAPAATSGPAFAVDVKIGRVVLAAGHDVTNVVAHVENNGTITTNARLTATSGTGPVVISLVPERGGRRLAAEAQDAGALLRAADVMQTMSGGRLVVAGRYDDTDPQHPLTGTAEMTDFRIRNAPAVGRLLQAMSLYGLVEVAQGPGLGFTRMIAPFRLRNEVLTLGDSRAYSASLGVTVKGDIDLNRNTLNLEGTVIPAYFFNSLLGRVPLIGRLFSPETGGGVFAATYSVRGRLDDPSVSVNPLAALTPGFLRGFFDIFDGSGPASAATGPAGSEHQR